MKLYDTFSYRGRNARTYLSEDGVEYVALCDVALMTGHGHNVATLLSLLPASADAKIVSPLGDPPKKWVARSAEVIKYLTSTLPATHSTFTKAPPSQGDAPSSVNGGVQDELQGKLDKYEALTSELQARLDKHDRDIAKLEARLEAQRKGRAFIQDLLDKVQ